MHNLLHEVDGEVHNDKILNQCSVKKQSKSNTNYMYMYVHQCHSEVPFSHLKKKQPDCFNAFKNGMYKGKKEINDLPKCKHMATKLHRGIA